jgi:hypothetical protein
MLKYSIKWMLQYPNVMQTKYAIGYVGDGEIDHFRIL